MDPAGADLTVLVVADQATELLDDIRDNRRAAVVFTRPSTQHQVQVKGDDARVVAATAQDLALAAGYRAPMVAELALIGVPKARVRALLAGGRAGGDRVLADVGVRADAATGCRPRAGDGAVTPGLDAIRNCVDGSQPGVMVTCAPDGTPNVA